MTSYVERRRTCEAMLITQDNATEVAAWCGGMVMPDGSIAFPVGEVLFQARLGDYIAKWPGAAFAKVTADDFEAAWEAVEGE